jgi:hypothetical protein
MWLIPLCCVGPPSLHSVVSVIALVDSVHK